MKKRKILKFFTKIINFFIFKSKKRVYVVPHPNCLTDYYDLLNYSSDNVLCILNYFKEQKTSFKSTFYIECYSKSRIELLKSIINEYPFKIKLVLSHINDTKRNGSIMIRMMNMIRRYRCKLWISDTGNGAFFDKLGCQTFICLSYSTPLKVGGALLPKHMQIEEWTYIDHFLETSLLTACVHSAEDRFKLQDSPILGFPRNDMLLKSNKKNIVLNWIRSKIDFNFKKIVVYVPTYRDYEGAYSDGCVLGFHNSSEELESFLDNEQILLIVKFHPLQKSCSSHFTKHIISYEKKWDFSLYDLLSVCDLLISDYSSVIHDFVLTNKPIVIDAFDYERYKETRGFAFEPLEYIMPSQICTTFDALLNTIARDLGTKKRDNQYTMVQKMFHRYVDFDSCQRVSEYLKMFIK